MLTLHSFKEKHAKFITITYKKNGALTSEKLGVMAMKGHPTLRRFLEMDPHQTQFSIIPRTSRF